MTSDERHTIARAIMDALAALAPRSRRGKAETCLEALTALFGDQVSAFQQYGYQQGLEAAQPTVKAQLAAEYQQGLRDGILSVECRADARDPLFVEDAPELRKIQ